MCVWTHSANGAFNFEGTPPGQMQVFRMGDGAQQAFYGDSLGPLDTRK